MPSEEQDQVGKVAKAYFGNWNCDQSYGTSIF